MSMSVGSYSVIAGQLAVTMLAAPSSAAAACDKPKLVFVSWARLQRQVEQLADLVQSSAR
jgi:hypothetical protein